MLEDSYKAEEIYSYGQYRGLEGIPIGVKDNIDIAERGIQGMEVSTTAGTSSLIGHNPGFEGMIWHDYMRKYGVISAGKTNMSELGLGTASKNALHGTPLNP
jgi:Asp-tRNA(Asn)/Glu-tRNA(Gln) amidotransferase A subunit family amidase